jgi:WD40 repeat protein/class 3 adenylate cyclase
VVGAGSGVRAFLIIDIRGYSTFTSERGAAAAARLASTFTELGRDAIVARGGNILGLRGDEILAAFATAGQAVRAALDVQLACREATAQSPDFPLGVGAGLDMGEVVEADEGYHGAAINLASRLCSQARAGQVLVTDRIVGASEGDQDLAFVSIGTAQLKGFSERVEMFQARFPRSDRDAAPFPSPREPSPLPIELDDRTPVVGRDHELSWLRGMWRQARRGHGRIVLISGPPGVGKTRLAAELAAEVSATGAQMRYSGSGGSVRGEAVATVGAAAASGSPGLWVVEDLHLYPEAVASLSDAVDAVESGPALVIGLFREASGDPALSALRDRLDRRGDGSLQLGPLDLEGVRAVAGGYVADIEDLPAEAILRASGGIPASIHELVADWAGNEARRRLEAAAEWLAEGRSRQAAGLRFADNVIAAHLRRIYDAGRAPEDSPAGAVAARAAESCPYKGLGAFDEMDSSYFFGREQLIGELAAKTVGTGLLGVVGPSGSGKSSVVLAGLVPSLEAGLLPGSQRWEHAVIRPGRHPLAALEEVVGLPQPERGRLVLVVDQFEEVFTTSDPGERAAFIRRLVELATGTRTGAADVVVVITIRADYTGHCAPYPDLAELLASNLVLVGPMTAEELRRVIEAPARKAGVRVESTLVDALVEEVVGEPGGLPLLSTALVELWQARQGGWLRLEASQRLGGVRSAVARLAESSYEQFDVHERTAVRTTFLRLVDTGEGESAVRRRVRVSEFDVDDDPIVAHVLAVLTRDRLLTRDDGQVEIAHEALIREWPRLNRWLEGDASGRQLRSHITQSARQWSERGRDPSDLYQGVRLSAALDWSQAGDHSLNAVERQFLTASREAGQRQLQQQRRANRRLRALLTGTAVFLAVALIAGLFALVQRNHARSAQKVAEAQALQADAERVGTLAQTEPNLDLSLLLAVAGVKLEDRPETRSDLLAALQRTPGAFRIIRPSTSEITGVAISPDGKLMATGDASGAVHFDSLSTWTQSGPAIQLPAPVPPIGLVFSPDGRTVAVAAGKGNQSQVFLIDVATRRVRLIGSWAGIVAPIPNGSTTLAFSPDGATLAVGLANWSVSEAEPVSEQVVLLDPSTGKVEWQRPYPVLDGQLEVQVAFTPSGTLVTSAEQGTTDLWNPKTGEVVRRFPIGGRFALSPDGRQAALGINPPDGGDGNPSVKLLDLTTGRVRSLQSLAAVTLMATLQYTPDGRTLLAGSRDGDVRVWDISSGSITQTFASNSGGRTQIAIDPSGNTVVSGADDGSVIAWDLSGRQTLGRTFSWSRPDDACPETPCFVANPAGTVMATDDVDGTIDLVDLRTLKWYATLPGTKGLAANGLAFTPDDQLVSGDAGGNITFWDIQTGRAQRRLHVADPIYDVAVSPDGQQLAAMTQSNTSSTAEVDVIDLTTGSPLRSYPVPDGAEGLAYSPDGKDLVALGCCSPGSTVEIRDASSGRQLPSPRVPGQPYAIAFSPGTPVLGIGTPDGKLYQWNIERDVQVGPVITVAASNVLQIAYSPDGKLLEASLRDGSTRLIDLESGQQLGNSFPTVNGFTVPLFTATGDLLLGYVNTATDWPTGLAAWEHYACQVAGRDITPAEWASVLPDRPYQHVCPP